MKASVGGSGGDFPVLDENGYLARLVSIVDIGIHEGSYGAKHQCVFTWELPTEIGEDGRPYVISRFYTLSLNEKANMRKDIESMKGKIPVEKLEDPAFVDSMFTKLLSTPCQLSISQYKNKEGYLRNGIEGVGKPMKGAEIPAAINDLVLLDLENYDANVYNALPDWLKAKVDEGKPVFDAENVSNSEGAKKDEGDDIPFGEGDDDADW